MRPLPTKAIIPLSLSLAVLLLSACSIASDHRVPDGQSFARNYTTVAGDIDVGQLARIRNAKTVAGDIEIRERSRAKNLTTVAGDIHLAPDVTVDGSIKTVAGDISVDRGCTIVGNISTVAGHVTLAGSVIEGDVNLSHGKLDATQSRVLGTVRIRRSNADDTPITELTIGPDSEIREIVAEQGTKTRLRIHRSATVHSVSGVEPEYYE